MKESNSKTDSKKLADIVQLNRLRVATAENRWKAAKEQARAAKRRRKEVKLIARRAKKQVKQAKADLAEARKVLAKAAARLAKSGVRVAARKPVKAKARPVAKAVVATRRKAATGRRGRPVQVVTTLLQESASSPVPAQTGSFIGKREGTTSEPGAIEPGTLAVAASMAAVPAKAVPEIQPCKG